MQWLLLLEPQGVPKQGVGGTVVKGNMWSGETYVDSPGFHILDCVEMDHCADLHSCLNLWP